eukprot:881306_1
MLHNYLRGPACNIRLAYIRKLCFDDDNPWWKQDKKRHKAGKYEIPLHVHPIPNHMTLSRLYARSAKEQNEDINIELLKYFKAKDGVRFDLHSKHSVLWHYVESTRVNVHVLKFLIEDLGFVIQPQSQRNIALKYMENQFKREVIDWDVLNYFYKDLKVDFTAKQNGYKT